MPDNTEAAFRAGFKAGFEVSREGWNGESFNSHLAPSPFDDAECPDEAAENAAWNEYAKVQKACSIERGHGERANPKEQP